MHKLLVLLSLAAVCALPSAADAQTLKERQRKEKAFDPLIARLVELLKQHVSTETLGTDRPDKILIGLLKTLTSLLKHIRTARQSAGSKQQGGCSLAL